MGSLAVRKRNLSRRMMVRLAPFGTFAGLGAVVATTDAWLLAVPLGIAALFSGRRLLDRRENARRELLSRVRKTGGIVRLAREDRDRGVADEARGVAGRALRELGSFCQKSAADLDEDIFTIRRRRLEGAARLAAGGRDQAAYGSGGPAFHHQTHKDCRRIRAPGVDSPMRAPFESALQGRRGELAGYDDVLGGISMINAQLESAESLLGNLRGELLALDDSLISGPQDPGLARLKERIAYFRRGLDEVTRRVETLPATERIPTR